MSRTAEEVLEAALALPEEERAKVVARLQESIGETDQECEDADWDEEIARRLKAIDDGSAELIPAEDVHRELREKYEFFKG
jgi:putative addiction module component (TIGR02574 family)